MNTKNARMTILIEAKNLKKSFGAICAVDGVSLSVSAGEVLGFLGPNGAGKSTTMKLITGFLEPDSGTALIGGHSILEVPVLAKRMFGYLPEGAPAYPEMTPSEFLRFLGEARGMTPSEISSAIERVANQANLESVLHQTIETLSKGFRRRVGLASALLHDPQVLIMDEPTDGLDPNQKHEVRSLIRELGKEKAIILSTHILEEVETVCTRTVIINQGKVVFDGTPSELLAEAPSDEPGNKMDIVFRKITTADTAGVAS